MCSCGHQHPPSCAPHDHIPPQQHETALAAPYDTRYSQTHSPTDAGTAVSVLGFCARANLLRNAASRAWADGSSAPWAKALSANDNNNTKATWFRFMVPICRES